VSVSGAALVNKEVMYLSVCLWALL